MLRKTVRLWNIWGFAHEDFRNKEESGIHMTDYYELLEVTSTASVEVIRAAYKAGVKKYHPDNFTSEKDKARATEQLKLLNEALETLTDEARRAQYDEELEGEKRFFGKETGGGNSQNAKKAQWQTDAGYGQTSGSGATSGGYGQASGYRGRGGNSDASGYGDMGSEYGRTSGHGDTDSGYGGGDTSHDLTTQVEALIVRCKNEEEYLDLHDIILNDSAPEADKIQMLHILDEFAKVKLQQELNDESKLEDYRKELKSVRWSIVFCLVIGYFLTAKISWAFLAAIILSILAYCGAKDDRENFARADRAAHLVAIYRMHGFKI